MMRAALVIGGLVVAGAAGPGAMLRGWQAPGSQALRPPTIEDAIAMTRVRTAALDGTVVAFSPDGTKAAGVVWRGDLARNVNVYSLVVLDIPSSGREAAAPRTVLTKEFEGDPNEQFATPIAALSFLPDNRTIAFLARDGRGPAQVVAVDSESGGVRQLTQHPTAVRSYVLGPDGALKAFAAVADHPDDRERARRLEADGVFAMDQEVFPDRRRFMTGVQAVTAIRPRQIRQYFLAPRDGKPAAPFFDSRQSRPRTPPDLSDPVVAKAPLQTLEDEGSLSGTATLTGDAQGRRALLFPYALTDHPMPVERYRHYDTSNAYAKRSAAPYGLVDLATGRIERLIDAPHPQFGRDTGGPFWSADGASVVIFSLLPLQGDDAAAGAQPAQWVEVDIATRRIQPIGLAAGWRIVRWDRGTGDLIASRGSTIGRIRRTTGRSWAPLEEVGHVEGFHWFYPVATNGRIAIGAKEAATTPTELAAFDLETRRTSSLTDFNRALRARRYGAVETLKWSHKYEPNASGFLITPVDYTPGRRYPLVVLLDDGVLRQEGEPFLLDGTIQLSGHAIQMLAAAGFVVLYPREPASLRSVIETPAEGEYKREHVESAIALLEGRGLVDPSRVGLSGWSRAGYHTDWMLIHSPFRYAAATQIDGGGREYNDSMRPFTDAELGSIRTPLLFEPHGPRALVSLGGMADRMDAMGKPVDILYFATAPHSTERPQHRARSLGVHMDWWRFWLQGVEDPDPAKRRQYERWRGLRTRAGGGSSTPKGPTPNSQQRPTT